MGMFNNKLTVSELIEELQQHDGDMEVRFTYNYGDYWRTAVAQPIRSVEEGSVEHSEYHNMDKVVDMDDIDEDDEQEAEADAKPTLKRVIILG